MFPLRDWGSGKSGHPDSGLSQDWDSGQPSSKAHVLYLSRHCLRVCDTLSRLPTACLWSQMQSSHPLPYLLVAPYRSPGHATPSRWKQPHPRGGGLAKGSVQPNRARAGVLSFYSFSLLFFPLVLFFSFASSPLCSQAGLWGEGKVPAGVHTAVDKDITHPIKTFCRFHPGLGKQKIAPDDTCLLASFFFFFFFFSLVFLFFILFCSSAALLHPSQQCQIWATSATYTTTHSNVESLTHWARPGIKPVSS